MKNSIVLFLLPTIFFFSCNNKKETISPEIKNITESVYASGIVLSQNQYEVFPKVNGIVGKIFVEEGESIKKGDPIFKIENPNSKLSSENARLTAAANDYSTNIEKLKDARNDIELAYKKMQNDSLLFTRQKKLWDQKIGSLIELEQKELNFQQSKVVLKQAEVTYGDLKRQLKLTSDQSKNNLKIAKSIEDDLMIRSAVDGVVYKINIEQGEMAGTNSSLAVIGEDNFILELNIDEFDIVKLRKNQKVIVRLDSYKSQVFEAIITAIYPMMNERTRTFKAEAVFTKKPEMLYPNLTLEANIIITEKQQVLTIPTSYLMNDSTVMLEDRTLQKVKIGLKDYNLTEIVEGISSESKIILPEK